MRSVGVVRRCNTTTRCERKRTRTIPSIARENIDDDYGTDYGKNYTTSCLNMRSLTMSLEGGKASATKTLGSAFKSSTIPCQ